MRQEYDRTSTNRTIRLSAFNRLLTLWIFLSMPVGFGPDTYPLDRRFLESRHSPIDRRFHRRRPVIWEPEDANEK